MRRLLVLLVLAAAPLSMAQQNFGAVVHGLRTEGACQHGSPIGLPLVRWYDPDTEDIEDLAALASGDGRRVLAILASATYPGTLDIVEIRPGGGQIPFYTNPSLPAGTSLAVAADGTVFAMAGSQLVRISRTGVLEAMYPRTGRPSAIEVGADGCTIYYIDELLTIHRMNGCTGAPLPDFVRPGFIDDMVVLPSGQVLLAAGTEVRLYSANGAFERVVANLRGYGLGNNYAAAMAVREGDVYIAALHHCQSEKSVLLRVAFADGRELGRAPLDLTNAWDVAIGAAPSPGIPTLGEMALALLAFALAAGGALVLRLR